jgi:hypothetical protein
MVSALVLNRKHSKARFVNAFSNFRIMKPFTNGIMWEISALLKHLFPITGAYEWFGTRFI